MGFREATAPQIINVDQAFVIQASMRAAIYVTEM